MKYEIRDELVTFFLDNPKRTKDAPRTVSFAGSGLAQQQIIPILDALTKKLRGRAFETQSKVTTDFLRPFFGYFRATKSAWPLTSQEWQLTVLRFFQFYLTDSGWSSSSASNRLQRWSTTIGGWMEFIKEQEIIPRDVVIPTIKNKQIQSAAKDQHLLGQTSRARPLDPTPPRRSSW